MRLLRTTTILLFFCLSFSAFSQSVSLKGYAYEENNRGFLNEVKIMVLELPLRSVVAEATTDIKGEFTISDLPIGKTFLIRGTKNIFNTKEIEISTAGKSEGDKVFAKLEMARKPGYLFDATLAEKRTKDAQQVDAIQGALIEIYNNTTDKVELILPDHPNPYFSFTFEQGNHYTIMIRQDSFLTKRIEAYVNINGCIVCMDGLKDVGPGVTDNLTHGFNMGTLLANIELDRADLNSTIEIENIYYDLNKWDIRDDAAVELDKVVQLLKDNPSVKLELGSHTDSRGSDKFNLDLSQKRAKAAVAYITSNAGINKDQIVAKGYGETKLVNGCKNGVQCSERRHQKNRRTELKIIGFKPEKIFKSLRQIISEEKFIEELESDDFASGQIKVGADGKIETPKSSKSETSKVSTSKVPTPPIKKEIVSENPAIETAEVITTKTVETPMPPAKVEQPVETKPALQQPVKPQKEEAVITKPSKKLEPETRPTQAVEDDIVAAAKESLKKMGETPTHSTKVGSEQEIMKSSSQNSASSTPPSGEMISKITFLSENYTGYKIEIINSPIELTSDNQLFKKFESLNIQILPENRFSYLTGDFYSERTALYYLNNNIIDDYNNARLIKFINGKRM